MKSEAKTVAQYLAQLPADRRRAVEVVRQVILDNLDADYEEGMQYGMISYYVPHRVYPAGYHCDPKQPLPFVCLASQKNYFVVHLTSIYMDPTQLGQFQKDYAKTGKRLDMGKACVRFRKLEDLPLELIGRSIKNVPARKHIEIYEKALSAPRTGPPRKAAQAKKAAPKKKKPAARTAKKTVKSTKKKAAKRRG